MPDIAQNVIVNFEIGTNELTPALEQLAKGGKIDATGFKGIQDAINATATDTKGLIKQFKDVGTASVKMGKSVEDAFGAGITDALDEAGVSLKEFETALKKTTQPSVSLKKEMLQLKEALARMKAEGKDTGKEFEALRARAGKLADAISDANAEIKNAGSDTRGIDNVVGSISALAGGYAAVQGAAALFGEENEDLQKALLKVNGAMAIATGTQQLLQAVQKEGALIKLKDVIATGAQTAATTLYTFVMGGATVATKVFRAALLATGIGAIIVLVVGLVQAMSNYSEKTESAADAQQRLADATANLNKALGETVQFLNDVNALNVLRAKAAGKSEAEITAIERKGIQDRIDARKKAIDQAIKDGLSISEITEQQNADINALQKFDLDVQIKRNAKQAEFNKKRLDALKKAQEDAKAQENEAAKNAIQAAIDRVNKEIQAEQIGFENKSDIDAQTYEEKKKNAQDWDTQWKSFQESLTKSSEIESAKRKKQEEDERAARIKNINNMIEVASRVSNIFASLSALQTERTHQEIEAMRKRVQMDLEAGIITTKAAALRMKQIDEKERTARRKQAEREKSLAVFQALLGIPKAVLQGLSTGGPLLAAVYGALAAIEAGLIIARPIPKFFKGKKDNYEGPSVVGDMGAELVEQNGRMYLYTKPTQTYLGAKDKVYTAAETRTIMHNTNIRTVTPAAHNGFDYDRLAKSIPVSNTQVSIDKDFIRESVRDGLMITNYWTKRYSSKR